MSTTIDQRVVEMRFDNKNFESNVSTTMSSLEKLKQRLNLTGASKGLDDINTSAKKINLSGVGTAVETVSAKFSAMNVIAMTTLANITNQAVNTGKRMISALTIDPIKTGFQEYETQINATQTILANTASKGSTIDDVNRALEELNKYADKTIYNFTEMTRNIGTFTAAGIDLDTSVNAIQGIANLAAVSGSTSQQASTAMYQLSQALAAGTVKLMDWNSVVNAGMGGEMFQNALKETSELLGTGAEAAIKARGSFRESLRDGWLTAEVLTETLKKFTTTGANEYVAEYIGESPEVVKAALDEAEAMYGEAEAIEYASKALAEKSGKNQEEIKQALQFAKNAEDAATKVKTFSQLWDVLKESAQSGWAQSWKLIVGDFEQAKNLITPLADFLTGIINGMSDARNKLLESALGKSFTGLLDNVKKSTDGVKAAVDSVQDYAKIVDEILGGKWGNGKQRWHSLTQAGYDWAHAQNLVNEKLGDATRHTTKYKEAQNGVTESTSKTRDELGKLFVDIENGEGSWDNISSKIEAAGISTSEFEEKVKSILKENGRDVDGLVYSYNGLGNAVEATEVPASVLQEAFDELNKTQTKLDEATVNTIISLTKMSDAQLKQKGYSDEQIKSFRELAEAAEKTGIPLDEFIRNIDQIDGRYLLFNSFKNVGQSLVTIFKAMGQAWKEVFPPMTGDQLFDIIAGMHKFSTHLVIGEDTAKNLTRTLKGVFAVIGMITDILGGGFKIAFKLVTALLGYFDTDILSVTASIGDALVAFREATDLTNLFGKAIEFAAPYVKKFAEYIGKLFKEFSKLPGIDNFIDGIKDAFSTITQVDFSDPKAFTYIFENIQSAFSQLKNVDLKSVGEFVFDGLILGLWDGAKNVIKIIGETALSLIEKFCEITGIKSPSKVFMTLGGFIIAGLILGIKEGVVSVPESLQGIVDKCIAVIQNIDWGTIFAAGVTIAGLMFIKKIGDALESFAAPFEGLGDILEETSKLVKSFGKVTKAMALEIKTKALKNLAVSLLILVGAIAILVNLDTTPAEMWNATLIIAALAGVLALLAWATGKMSDASVTIDKNGASISGLKQNLLTIGLAMLTMAAIVKIVGSMKPEEAKQGFIALAGMMLAMLGFLAIIRKIVSNKAAKNISEIGVLMSKLAFAMLLMVGVVKLAGKLSGEELGKGALFAIGFSLFVAAITSITKGGSKEHISKVGGMIIKVAIAMGLMVAVVKLVDLLDANEMFKGAVFAAAFILFVKGLVKAATIGKDNEIAKLGGLLLSISVSMMLMVGVCKLINKLSAEEMIKGAIFAAAFVLFVKGLVAVTTIGSDKQIAKVTGTILGLSIALGIMAAVCMMLSLLSVESLVKGVTAMTILGSVMALMIWATRGVNDIKGNLIVMAAAIAILAVAVAGLSFIDPSRLAGATAAVSMILGMFALVLKSSKNVTGSMGTLIVLTVAIGLLAGILWALSTLEVQASLTNAAALSVLLVAVSAAMLILSKASLSINKALTGVVALTAMAVPLLAFVGVLAVMQNVQKATTNTKALVTLASALTLLLIPLTMVGVFAINALIGVGLLTAMAIPLLAFVGILALMEGISNATANTKLLTDLMTTMTDMLIKLAIVGPLALIGVGAMAGLTGLMVALGGLAIAVGALMDKFPSIQKFLDTGLPMLEQLAGSIGTMIGKFIGGIAEGVMSVLPEIANSLSAFMDNVQPFIEGSKVIDETVLKGVGYLSGAILLLTAADLLAGITAFPGMSFTDLGKQLTGFITAAMPFIVGVQTIDSSAVEAAKSLAEIILILTAADLINGIVSSFGGSVDFSEFGTQLSTFAEAVCDFSNTLSQNGGINDEAITSATKAGTLLVELNKSLPRSGGWVQDIIGEKDFSTFAESCKAFAQCIIDINGVISQEGFTIETEKLDQIVKAGTKFSELNNSLPRTGGIAQDLAGEKDLVKFGASVSAFVSLMKGVSLALGDEGFTVQTEKIDQLVTAGTKFSDLNNALPKTDGIAQDLAGEQDLATFGASVSAFVSLMKGISLALSEEGFTVPVDSFDDIKTAGEKLANLQSVLPKSGGWWQDIAGEQDIGDFGKKIKSFGDAIVEFSNSAVGLDSAGIDLSIRTASRIKGLITSLADLDTSGLAAFTGVGTGGFGADGAAYKIAQAISAYSEEVAGIDTTAVSTSVTAAMRLKSLIANLVDLDTTGIENFKPGGIASQIKGYADKVADMDTSAVSSSISLANRLKNFITGLAGLDTTGVASFTLVKFIGSSLKGYADSVGGIDYESVSASASNVKRLISLIASMAGLDTSGVSSFKSAINSLATTDMAGFKAAFSDTSKFTAVGTNIVNAIKNGISSGSASLTATGKTLVTNLVGGINAASVTANMAIIRILTSMTQAITSKKETFKNQGSALMESLISGVKSKDNSVKTSVRSSVSLAAKSIRDYYDSFYNAGSYLVSGFASGISENTYKATAKAEAMAKAAAKAAEEALDINSPSKVFRAIGYSVPEGFAQGIDRLAYMAANSAVDMGDTAISAISKSISRISEAVNSDIDAQPTIRPVLDLSDVRSGASAISGLFDSPASIGVMANVGAISNSMNHRQNGVSNGDVVNAIDKLRHGLNNIGNTYYTIDGITYSNGDEIADAIQRLTRAVRVEGRI